MTKNESSYLKECILFRESFSKIKKLVQDTIVHVSNYKKKYLFFKDKRMHLEKDSHSYFFSYKIPALLIKKNPVSYIKNKNHNKKLKKLKIGEYIPEIYVDLHGLTIIQAKKELGNLILICHKEKLKCAGIIHGHGKDVLKQMVPIWLANHPDVLAFHKAPKLFGNNAAIVVLISNEYK